MRHYEIVFMVHPDQSEQVPGMIERYTAAINKDGGNEEIDEERDLEVQRLFGLGRGKGHVVFFDQPDDQGPDETGDADEGAQGGEMGNEGPSAFLFFQGRRRGGGR